jgi:hypothetical protein
MPNLRYKTYTPQYFETFKDIVPDGEEHYPSDAQSPPTPQRRSSGLAQPSPYATTQSDYHTRKPSVSNDVWPTSAGSDQIPSIQHLQGAPPQYLPLPPPNSFGYQHPSFSLSGPGSGPMPIPSYGGPRIVIDTLSEHSYRSVSGATSPAFSGYDPSQGSRSPSQAHGLVPFSIDTKANHLAPPSFASRRNTATTLGSDDGRLTPSSFWAERFGAAGPVSIASSVALDSDHEPETPSDSLKELTREQMEWLKTLEHACNEDQHYLAHYLEHMVMEFHGQELGKRHPFRMLITTLCPQEPALFHAILALAATDLAYNKRKTNAVLALGHAQVHAKAAQRLFQDKLSDVRYEQTTGALATAYMLSVLDVKHARPLQYTQVVLDMVKARSSAGRLYEGGAWLVFYLARFGVLSSMFGGPGSLLNYLIETDQMPTAGQGNMFPFVKKTEDERIEYTVISPIHSLHFKLTIAMCKLSVLAKSRTLVDSFDGDKFRSTLNDIRNEIEQVWRSKPKVVDELNGDEVEEIFNTRWLTGVPAAQQVHADFHAMRLFIELLSPGFLRAEVVTDSALAISRIFDHICKAKLVFARRFILMPLFLASLVAPEIALRQGLHSVLQRVASGEASWNKALDVSVALLEQQMAETKRTGMVRAIEWSQVCDELSHLVLW